MTNPTFCGFVSIVGRPNVGKSTLMNHLIGQKISITSRKPQTTRHKVTGVYSMGQYQFIFVDTPGFQKLYLTNLNQALNQSVINSLSAVDAIIFVVEAGKFNQGDEEVLCLLPPDAHVVLVVNKRDQYKEPGALAAYIQKIMHKFSFKQVISVSAKHGHGLDQVLDVLKEYLPAGEFLYPAEQLTDKSSKFLASEIIREKLFRSLGEELPYCLMVEIDKLEQSEKIVRIYATIIVDKEKQKPMIIGKGGEKLKKISIDSRLDMEKLFALQVHLELWVKVKSGFADELKFLHQFE
jgi:GTP-binding protein Era